jgi:glyoxylase-like metal-dependent hydrolase (beta-lactamase superfamily II)
VIFDAPGGLVVVDTGRHPWHSDAILAYAEQRRRPITAIVNTHWHLDHSSGNRRLTARYPNAPLFTSSAVDRALAPEGFLARSLVSARTRAADPTHTGVQREETEKSIATMEAAESLRADVALDSSSRRRIGGRRFDVHVAGGAVTDADVWLYDRRTRVAVIGDLVTMPGPFFETACPNQWRAALDAVWAAPFRIAIPGHGEPMTRDQFGAYRSAFNTFMDCVMTDAEVDACATVWADGVASLTGDNLNLTRQNAFDTAQYYVSFLRRNGGKSRDCLSS